MSGVADCRPRLRRHAAADLPCACRSGCPCWWWDPSATSTLSSWSAFFAYMKTNPYYQFANYTLSVIPLFILMGALAERPACRTTCSAAAESSSAACGAGWRMAVIGACTAFGAICGSSVATTATFGRAALPELQRYGYDDGFATGTIAVGGTLGILHPAVHHPGRLCHHHRAEHRQAVQGGADPRPAGGAVLYACDRLDRSPPPGGGARPAAGGRRRSRGKAAAQLWPVLARGSDAWSAASTAASSRRPKALPSAPSPCC